MADRMFGLIAAGRQPDMFKQIGETDFLCELPAAESVNHLVIFMTGSEVFPDGYGAAVYVCWQMRGAASSWTYLGAISNSKPSAIFKIAQSAGSTLFAGTIYSGTQGTAQVGLKVDLLENIESLQAETSTKVTTQSTLAEFGEKMVQNLVNYVESYATKIPKPDGSGYGDYIPTGALQEWVNNFSRRFKQNPDFWRSLRNN